MKSLLEFEKQQQISLPDVYKKFYRRCSISMPQKLIGTDLFIFYPNLKESAIELLIENGLENFLDDTDFVFMMHQGYIFWYFKADGTPDPMVYGYQETKLSPDKLDTLSKFLGEYA